MCCEKCNKMTGMLVLAFGILFLLRDLNVWNFWNIQWWTVAFLVGGLIVVCTSCCPMCKTDKKK
ncbi:MAG: hypothetical protein KJ583_04530 [Nanoarchaeota archaeon]|nr:hypothetical protein [Nanoarchaeota archaeon]MBU1270022.1 hypothetical protein [Nanoarchaeota archaeon]MBU1604558.1 hypothetical protein [Nanoarchaeota archaeon]MBU2443626.1 hypothetical protein [Nanoarchaeota archaeon]